MKKILWLVTAAASCLLIIFIFFGASTLQKAREKEIQTVENIAGAVLEQYPQAEQLIMAAAMDSEYSNRPFGQERLSRYGYHTGMDPQSSYQRALFFYLLVSVGLVGCMLSFGITLLYYNKKRHQKRTQQLLDILDDCLRGDYRFINDVKRMESFENSLFTDSLTKLGENLRLKTERLNDEQDHTKTLVTNISHQLKTPISALKTCFSMYLEADNESERTEFLQRCQSQMDKLEALTASLIQISRLESKLISLNKTQTALSEILLGSVNTVYDKARLKNIQIETADFTDLSLYLDKKWTIESISNILDNAVKYSPVKSSILIRVQRLYSFVRIEIEDHGLGIPKKEQNQIFQRFYRGQSEAVRSQEGSGVGLYLTRSILEEQGGTVSVRSRNGEGSTFIIHLPL